MNITNSIIHIGVNDRTLDLFENQYRLKYGMSYNSYLILDEKIAVMDSVDARATNPWFDNLKLLLNGKTPDYLIVSHMEPDHAANIQTFIKTYPEAQIVCSTKAVDMITQFFDIDLKAKCKIVKEGDTLLLGKHHLHFLMAPMVHWPEVLVSYESTEKILFSADAFGKFGTTDAPEEWLDEGRRYYINICGKYGSPVQTLLKKIANYEIQAICSLHGFVLTQNIDFYIQKYAIWSSYQPENEGVFIAYASIYGHTAQAAIRLAGKLREEGLTVETCDLARDDMAQAVSNAFKYSKMILAASSYDGGLFPPMEEFINHLKSKTYQKRKVGFIENGTWAPIAGNLMKNAFESMKEISIYEPMVTLKSCLKPNSEEQLNLLVESVKNA